MFKFLKDKLKETVQKFSKAAEEDAEVTEEDVLVDEPQETTSQEELVEAPQEETQPEADAETESKDVEQEPALVVEEPSSEKTFEEVSSDESLSEPEAVPEKKPSAETSEPIIEESVPETKDIEEHSFEEDTEPVSEDKNEKKVIPEPISQDSSVEEPESVIEKESSEFLEQEQLSKPRKTDIVTEEPFEEKEDSQEDVVVKDMEEPEEKKEGFFSRLFHKKKDKEPEEDLDEETSDPSSEKSDVEESLPKIPSPAESTDVVEETSIPASDVKSDSGEKIHKQAVHDELLQDVKDDATRKKAGFFKKIKQRVVKFQLTDEVFEDLFWEFELSLLENNVAVEVIEKIKADLKEQLTSENISRRGVEQIILDSLKDSLSDVLDVEPVDILERIHTKKPYVICVVGVNGSGKTTTLAKLVKYLQNNNLSVVVAASDTFRAAAIQQLEEHTNKLGVKLIKHDYNADPAAVAFDAIKHATAKSVDVVLIDTAGRLQSNSNLMDELHKLIRVNKPDFNLFIGESITGNDCVEQAMAFNDLVGIDGMILSKADVDDKGGAAISVSYMTKKPILFLGTGQGYDDLTPFDKDKLLETLGL